MRFAEILFEKLPASASAAEPFADLLYANELRAKNDAFQLFWKSAALPGVPLPLVEAATPRGYRTTTKRRVTSHGKAGISLGFSDRTPPRTVAPSALDLPAHNRVYAFILDKLLTPAYAPLAHALNWVILRGSTQRQCLILNVFKMDGAVVRKAKLLADHVAANEAGVISAMMYYDPTRSDYYLTAERPKSGVDMKHLFGPRLLTLDVAGLRLKYPPTVFSQVNESMVAAMTERARRMLGLTNRDRFLDLYCGFGMFSFSLGKDAFETVGVELEGDAIASAKETAHRQFPSSRFRFVASRITADSAARNLPPVSRDAPEVMLLDPPRKGAEPGVIETLAKRKPRRVVQICCGTDEMVPAVRTWVSAGYKVDEIAPMDLFSGTAGLETLVSFYRSA